MGDSEKQLRIGIDIGSTTVKAIALAPNGTVLHSIYRRHHAHQVETALNVLEDLDAALAAADADGKSRTSNVRVAVTGSGGNGIAEALGVPFVQEVIANSIAVQAHYPRARVAIELGGQDAKMVFFEPGAPDPATGEPTLKVDDMRMNGSCAGGTGAFLDEIATLLKVPVEELDALAAQGTMIYSISGRCGVYAKTDIQPLINQGAAREDIALSTFHAVAKQTLGGLAQGLDVVPPVIFEGGPLTFNPTLIRVFKERLHISGMDAIVPESPETIVAHGAALALDRLFADTTPTTLADARARLDAAAPALQEQASAGKPFFPNSAARAAFQAHHRLAAAPPGPAAYKPGSRVPVFLGIDSGSTTTKFALIDNAGNLVDSFYANNEGEPLDVLRDALADLQDRWQAAGVDLEFCGVATTGYGELLFARALHADAHVVETVAHALAAARYVDDATFILDIGGQDMKAIWIDQGIVTDILVNEACSSGCGSFLENFAHALGIRTHDIADAAFASASPAELGSRCTVFMNSSVVTEQRNGKSPNDIMAGLCRSIIENVFTKVIRVPNLDALGERIVVQGGTFANDAVLAAFEDYVGRPVTRAPYPGLMGAIGAALFAQRETRTHQLPDGAWLTSDFIGLDAARTLDYAQESNAVCPFCTNACSRTIVRFSDGSTWVTGNRCERGQVVGDPHDAAVRTAAKEAAMRRQSVPNLYEVREKLLFKDYPAPQLCGTRGITVGIPRVLMHWDSMPFWTTFWRALGFPVKLSPLSTREIYEDGLPAVASDTVCFPAKLVHGHIRALEQAHVDRIWFPTITTVASENTEDTSQSMCAVVKGYPIVIRNSDNPSGRANVQLDAPLFHWYTDSDRNSQLKDYMSTTFGIAPELTARAIDAADAAQADYRTQLLKAGEAALEGARRNGGYAVILASRPYHNDPLVNHDLPQMFTELGIPVLTPDAVPGAADVDLSRSRIDIVNNYHARMLSCAIMAAEDPALEYAQVVSFGCGHDAYLSDEIVRLTHAIAEKSPLILKVDESDIAGPLRIRVRSFVETLALRRTERTAAPARPLADPYPVKFKKRDRREKVILIPNTSHAFSRLMAAVFVKQGVRAVPIPIGRDEAIRLGKKYVHNDICFPAQITIGECLAELESGKWDDADVAVGTGKYIGDCRLTHYGALLRKALDDAGFAHVPIVTNDDVDYHNLHPGFKMSVASAARIAYGLPMIDALEELLRKIRPYELEPGTADAAFEHAVDALMEGMEHSGMRGAKRGFSRAIQIMGDVRYDRSHPRPRVLIVGEYLLNFHPGANHDVEQYLEDNGFEVIEARMTDVIRKTYFYKGAQISEYDLDKPFKEAAWYKVANGLFEHAHNVCDAIASAHPLYEPACRMPDLVVESDPIIHHTFDAGEGVLIPGEIIHHANHGCNSFLILQPFGCLPNHIVGRGIVKRLRELYPAAQILSLDYDPDVSFANIENRLQMLVMNARAEQEAEEASANLSNVTDEVSAIAEEERRLVRQVADVAATYNEGNQPTPEFARNLTIRMREMLEREEQLVARAKDAITAARRAASQAAARASAKHADGKRPSAQESESETAQAKGTAQAALRVYEIARDMRTRTSRSLASLSALAAEDTPSGTVRKIREDLAVHAEDVRAFATRLLEETKTLIKR